MRITDFTELTIPTSNDLLVVVDVVNDITKKLKLSSLPISTSVTTALATKQDTLVSGTNIKTLNSVSLLGSGDIVLAATPSGVAGAIQFSNGSAFASDATNFFWDDTNNRLGVGTDSGLIAQAHFQNNTSLVNEIFVGSRFATSGTRYDGVRIGTLSNATGFIQGNSGLNLTSAYPIFLQPNGSDVGIGFSNISPTARLHIKGSGSTSATTSLLVQNSAGTAAFQVKDNQQVQINLGSTLSDVTTPNLTFSSSQTGIYSPNPNQLGIVCYANETARFIYGSSLHNGALNIGKFANPNNNAFFGWCSDGSLEITGNAQSVFVNPTNNSSLVIGASADLGARLGIKGSGSTSATTSLLVQNSSASDLLKISDDGSVLFGVPSTIFTAFQLTSSVGRLQINTNDNSTYGTIIRSFNAAGTDNQKLSFWASGFNFETNGGLQVSNNATGAVASAILQADSTTKGFLPPRMTTTQKNAIATPAAGLVVYDSTTNKLCCYNGSTWNDLF